MVGNVRGAPVCGGAGDPAGAGSPGGGWLGMVEDGGETSSRSHVRCQARGRDASRVPAPRWAATPRALEDPTTGTPQPHEIR